MVKKAIKPELEEKGYKVELVEFSDYIQPNIALNQGSIDANLFQHTIYLENFEKENNMDLSALITVPTAPMGVYSNVFRSIDEVKTKRLLRFRMIRQMRPEHLIHPDAGLLEISKDADPLTVSEKDVTSNPKIWYSNRLKQDNSLVLLKVQIYQQFQEILRLRQG